MRHQFSASSIVLLEKEVYCYQIDLIYLYKVCPAQVWEMCGYPEEIDLGEPKLVCLCENFLEIPPVAEYQQLLTDLEYMEGATLGKGRRKAFNQKVWAQVGIPKSL